MLWPMEYLFPEASRPMTFNYVKSADLEGWSRGPWTPILNPIVKILHCKHNYHLTPTPGKILDPCMYNFKNQKYIFLKLSIIMRYTGRGRDDLNKK